MPSPALMRLSRSLLLRWPAAVYVSAFRGTPLLVQLFLIYYGLPQLGLELPPLIAAGKLKALGVTTAILGNCGFTIAPCKPQDRDLTMRHLTHVEGMSLDALRAGIRWGFESFPQYLDMLQAQGVGPNVACFAGHSAIRTFVLGEQATERAATDAEERIEIVGHGRAQPSARRRPRRSLTTSTVASACG